MDQRTLELAGLLTEARKNPLAAMADAKAADNRNPKGDTVEVGFELWDDLHEIQNAKQKLQRILTDIHDTAQQTERGGPKVKMKAEYAKDIQAVIQLCQKINRAVD